MNVRWNISASINNGNATWSFQNYWTSQGNSFLRFFCKTELHADYLNVNIS